MLLALLKKTLYRAYGDENSWIFAAIKDYTPESLVAIYIIVHHHSADYISFPLGSLGPLWYIWKWSSAHVYARGRKQCCKLHYCL